VQYNFYGHSNSQLKSRTCFLYAAPKPDISQKIEALGDFTKMKTVAKKAKRIGLLFSVAEIATTVQPDRCEDIQDVETKDYIFTDGCGLISPKLAHELARKVGVAFRNIRYTPSVFQIRYRGYKGVVMLDLGMKGKTLIKFRKSMKKFSGASDMSFSVIEYSKVFISCYNSDLI
jgi:regulator of nonsense transcripts 1